MSRFLDTSLFRAPALRLLVGLIFALLILPQ
jgi:hypothetical protein